MVTKQNKEKTITHYQLEIVGCATARNLSLINQPYYIGKIDVPKKYNNSNRYTAVQVVEESVNKVITNNSVAVFDKQFENYNNKIILIRLNHEFTIKKYYEKRRYYA